MSLSSLTLKPLPALRDNYIWLASAANGATLIVDPSESEPVFAALQGSGLTPVAILLTHHHNDHIGGVPALLRQFDLPVYAPPDERITSATVRVADGQELGFVELDLQLNVLAIPGHTLSHVAFFGGSALFCGDTLFSMGCGRLFEGTPAQMLASLDRLAALPPATRVCCGHEYALANLAFALTVDPLNSALQARQREATLQRAAGRATLPTTLQTERDGNPFLRVDTDAVRDYLAARGELCSDRVARFGALRRAKDEFRAPLE